MLRLDWRFGLRVYAVTGKKKLLNGPLFVISAAQLCFGLYAIARVATHPSKFINRSLICARTHQPLAMPLPDINLDVFKICIYERWRVGELLYINLATAFGTHPPPGFQYDTISGVLTRLALVAAS